LDVCINKRIIKKFPNIIYGSNRVKCALSEYIWVLGVIVNRWYGSEGCLFLGWPPYILNVCINKRILTIYLYIIYGSNRVKCALSEYIW